MLSTVERDVDVRGIDPFSGPFSAPASVACEGVRVPPHDQRTVATSVSAMSAARRSERRLVTGRADGNGV